MASNFNESMSLIDEYDVQLKNQLVHFMNMSLTQTQIGSALGMCRNTVAKYMNKFGISKKQRFSLISGNCSLFGYSLSLKSCTIGRRIFG